MITTIIAGIIIIILVAYFRLDKKKNLQKMLDSLKIFFLGSSFEVGISFEYKDGRNSEDYYESIIKHLGNSVEKMKLHNNIKIKELPLVFKNRRKVEKYGQKNDIQLIIWGSITGDGEKENGQQIHEVVVNFYYANDKNESGLQSESEKQYKIFESNSKKDIKIISNNLVYTSTYILARILLENKRIIQAKELYESLYEEKDNFEYNFFKEIENNLLHCYHLLILESPTKKEELRVCKEICEKYLLIRPNSKFALTNLSVTEYLLGNKTESANIVEQLINFYPDYTATIINAGFIRLTQNRLDDALFYYKKAVKMTDHDSFNPVQVITFLQDEYKKTKDVNLLYVQGLIYAKFTSQTILAKECLNEFIQQEKREEFKKFKDHAYSILINIK